MPRGILQKRDLWVGDKQAGIGLRPERPFQILGLTTSLTLGDLVSNVFFFSCLANQFEHSRLHVKYRNARSYCRDVMSLSPWIDKVEPIAGEWPQWLYRLRPRLKPRRHAQIGALDGGRAYYYDMIVTNTMARDTTIYALPNPAVFRLPDGRADSLRRELAASGLKPDRWFAALHYREKSYEFGQRYEERNSDPAAFDALVDDIIALGGQAVRIGHPGMTPFAPRDGFVDLSLRPDSFMLQAAAVSHARFMVAGPSGPMTLAMAFAIPLTLVDAVDAGGVWGLAHTDVLTHEVTTPEGEVLRNATLREAGLLSGFRLADLIRLDPRCTMRKANASELRIVAQRLFDRTAGIDGWRPPPELPSMPKPNSVSWPLRPEYPMDWLKL
ncbi:MAG: TIGR04372 family glycosyltransferase [Parvibaculaceae bacterium]